jgi:hypothetical protein
MKPTGTSSARLAALTVLLGAGIAIASQFVAAYALEDRFGLTIETVTLFGKHGPFVVIAALGAIGALAWAVLSGSRQALVPLLGMGIAILLVFLLVDLPDAGDTGLYDTPGSGNLDATGAAAAGLWLELVGGLVIVLGTIGLMALDRDTIRSIRRGRPPGRGRSRPTRTSRTKRPGRSGTG